MHQFLKFIYFELAVCLTYTCCCVDSQTPDDGRKDRPKHVECWFKINKFEKLVHLVGLL
jgi:hypothetical protein